MEQCLSSEPSNVISERALIARINRKLRRNWAQLRKSRPGRAMSNLGDYFVVDTYNNIVTDFQLNLEEFGRDEGVLGSNERLADS